MRLLITPQTSGACLLVLLVSFYASVDTVDAFLARGITSKQLVHVHANTKSIPLIATRLDGPPIDRLPVVERPLQNHALFHQRKIPLPSIVQKYLQHFYGTLRRLYRSFLALQRLIPKRKHLLALAFAATVWLRGPLLVPNDMNVAHAASSPQTVIYRYQLKLASAQITINNHQEAPSISTMQLATARLQAKNLGTPMAIAHAKAKNGVVTSNNNLITAQNDLAVAGIATALGTAMVIVPGATFLVGRRRSDESKREDDVIASVNGDSQANVAFDKLEKGEKTGVIMTSEETMVTDTGIDELVPADEDVGAREQAMIADIPDTIMKDSEDHYTPDGKIETIDSPSPVYGNTKPNVLRELPFFVIDEQEHKNAPEEVQAIENPTHLNGDSRAEVGNNVVDQDLSADDGEAQLTDAANDANAEEEQSSIQKAIVVEYDRESIKKALERIKQELETKRHARKGFAGALKDDKGTSLFSEGPDRAKVLGDRVRQILDDIKVIDRHD